MIATGESPLSDGASRQKWAKLISNEAHTPSAFGTVETNRF